MDRPHHPAYPAHEAHVAPARARAQLWRIPVTLAAMAALNIALVLLLVRVATVLLPGAMVDLAGAPGDSPAGMVYVLAQFAVSALAMILVMQAVHQRGPRSLLGATASLWPDARRTMLAAGAIMLLGVVLFDMPGDSGVTRQIGTARWLAWMPLALPALLIQVTTEEVIFRGYLQQQMAARFAGRWAWMVLPSLLFGALHYDPAYGSMAVPLVLGTTLFGLVAADVTARSGSLGPAIALHFVNNFFAIFVISLQDDLAGLALWRAEIDLSDPAVTLPLLAVEAAMLACVWLAVRVALRR